MRDQCGGRGYGGCSDVEGGDEVSEKSDLMVQMRVCVLLVKTTVSQLDVCCAIV